MEMEEFISQAMKYTYGKSHALKITSFTEKQNIVCLINASQIFTSHDLLPTMELKKNINL